ncbi:MAG TPA: CehA/McbA family metallohydrolase [Terracidiphilus sp.]|nr:CehA/McbA family metallohydrolase [Terracidiphilus sp.]
MKLRACLSFLFVLASLAPAQPSAPDLVLAGKVTGRQNHTYFNIPFRVPSGVHRISIDFSYTGESTHTALDLAVADPFRFRGASGGNKSHVTIALSDATPSYLPGPIPAGVWKLQIAVPNIRANVVSQYRAEIRFNSRIEDRSFAALPLATGLRWYRGDLHMHTAHSDGACLSQTRKRIPCPAFLTVQTAADRGLDFIAVSDHNTVSQYNDLRELQPYFDKVLLIPAREVTTFYGHFNVFGTTQFIDYRVQPHGLSLNEVLRNVRRQNAIASINHADAPTGEICMGCGWTPATPFDLDLLTAVEVINGGSGFLNSSDFWDRELTSGHRLTAIGGSDNHNALIPAGHIGAIGRPTTVVEATELSVPAILDGIRSGRVFVDLTSSHDKLIDLEATAGESHASMGGNLDEPAGAPVALSIHVAACAGDTLHLLLDGHEDPSLTPLAINSVDATLHARRTTDGARHFIRAEVRDAHGALLLLSNPVYINFPPRSQN